MTTFMPQLGANQTPLHIRQIASAHPSPKEQLWIDPGASENFHLPEPPNFCLEGHAWMAASAQSQQVHI